MTEMATSLGISRILTGFVLLWSSGLKAEAQKNSSEPGDTRLRKGTTRCDGNLEMKVYNKWQPVDDVYFDWNLKTAAKVCRKLDCGSVISAKLRHRSTPVNVWKIHASSIQNDTVLREDVSVKSQHSSTSIDITCSDSIRLVNGTSLCSGRLELSTNQSWFKVCGGDFNLQDAKVVCRQLGCGTPLNLQRVLYENIKIAEWTKEFRCRENDSTLLDCDSFESARNTCSPIEITCSEPDIIRLVGEPSRCAGRLEMKLQDAWKPVDGLEGDLKSAALVCGQLKCGSVASTKTKNIEARFMWGIPSYTVQSGSELREWASIRSWHSESIVKIYCSDLLFQPIISISPSTNWVYRSSKFTITCSIKPQYHSGSFNLIIHTTSKTTHIYTQKAFNHTAHFTFPAADHSHHGNYRCVYHIYIKSYNFSSESEPLSLTISDNPIPFFIHLAVLLAFALCVSAICFCTQATRGQEPEEQKNIERGYCNLGASRADVGPHDVTGTIETAV